MRSSSCCDKKLITPSNSSWMLISEKKTVKKRYRKYIIIQNRITVLLKLLSNFANPMKPSVNALQVNK